MNLLLTGSPNRGILVGMASELSNNPTTHTVDLSGLPQPVAEDIKRLVQTLREKMPAQEVTNGPPSTRAAEERKPLIGRLAHLGLKTPSLDEFKEASREAWANFPRDFPDPAKK